MTQVEENAQLVETKISNQLIEVLWKDGQSRHFHNIWLRDNCRCEHCGDPAIGRRVLRLTDLDLHPGISSVKIFDNQLKIIWSDDHHSEFTSDWLRANAYDDKTRRSKAFNPSLWNAAFRAQPPIFDHGDIAGSEQGLFDVLQTVRDFGLCFIRNSTPTAGTLETFALRIGYPQESNFGRVQDLVVDRKKSSIANDVQGLKPHTDEPYRASPSGILLFHCIETDITGAGSSIFLDGFEIAEQLRTEDPEGFAVLSQNTQSFRRFFNNDVDLIAEFPIISVDEFDQVVGIRLNDRVAAPLSIASDKVEVYYRALKRLLQLSEDNQRALKLTLKPGDIAIFDNHRILHGRTDLTIKGSRWLQWIQIERGDFHSSLRILADRLGIKRDSKPLLKGAYG